MRRKLVAANWKMNGNRAANAAWAAAFSAAPAPGCDVVVCAPFVYLPQMLDALGSSAAQVGAQNMSEAAPGAFTGEVAGEKSIKKPAVQKAVASKPKKSNKAAKT